MKRRDFFKVIPGLLATAVLAVRAKPERTTLFLPPAHGKTRLFPRCAAILRGQQCPRNALPRQLVCRVHGGVAKKEGLWIIDDPYPRKTNFASYDGVDDFDVRAGGSISAIHAGTVRY